MQTHENNPAAIKVLYDSIKLISELFYSLNYQVRYLAAVLQPCLTCVSRICQLSLKTTWAHGWKASQRCLACLPTQP